MLYSVDHKLRQVYGGSLVDVADPSPEVVVLRSQLVNHAKAMLLGYLQKVRASRRRTGNDESRLDIVEKRVDRVSHSIQQFSYQ